MACAWDRDPGLFANVLGQTVDLPAPYRYALWTGAAISLLAIVPLSLIGRVGHVASRERAPARGPFPILPVALLFVHVCLSHGGRASCQAFYCAYMDAVLRLSPSSIGLLTSAGLFVAVLSPLLTPRLAARRGNGWTLMVTTLGTAVSLALVALIPHWAAAGAGRLGVALLASMWMPALQVFQMEWVEERWRSLAYGAVSTAISLSYGSASIAGGYIVAAWGYSSLFLLGVVLSLAGTVVIQYIRGRSAVLFAQTTPRSRHHG